LLPFGQAAQTPPQSTSDSSWFFMPSSQDGLSAQTPSAQWPLVQSAGPWQACPIGQWGHPPPQSVSDSSWFRRPSKQVGRSTQASSRYGSSAQDGLGSAPSGTSPSQRSLAKGGSRSSSSRRNATTCCSSTSLRVTPSWAATASASVAAEPSCR